MGQLTSSAFNLRPMRQGIKEPTVNAIKVPMSFDYKWTSGEEELITTTRKHLWTTDMSDCVTVATYTPSTAVGSRTHLQGGAVNKVWLRQLAEILEPASTVIIVAGGSATADMWNEVKFESLREQIRKGLRQIAALDDEGNVKSPPDSSQFINIYAPAVHVIGRSRHTGFVFKKSGRHGALNPEGF